MTSRRPITAEHTPLDIQALKQILDNIPVQMYWCQKAGLADELTMLLKQKKQLEESIQKYKEYIDSYSKLSTLVKKTRLSSLLLVETSIQIQVWSLDFGLRIMANHVSKQEGEQSHDKAKTNGSCDNRQRQTRRFFRLPTET